MATDVLSTPISQQTEDEGKLEVLIDELLGQGLGYVEWKSELKARGDVTWSEALKNTIIRREFGFFKEEILHLKSEPNKSKGLQSKTNSLESILKRLQGLEWGNGMPNEMEERKQTGRLLGKDAKARCLQYHVARWKNDGNSVPKPSVVANKSRNLSNTHNEKPNWFDQINMPMNTAVITSPKTELPTISCSENGLPKSSESRPFRNSSSKVSSLFGQAAKIPVCDPTLHGYTEIPWVPLSSNHEIELNDGDITPDEIFRYIDQNSSVPSSTSCQEFSFELPRGDGINDSYGTYVHQASQDPRVQMKLLEEIMNSYGPPQNDSAVLSDSDWLTTLDQPENTPVSGVSLFVQQCSTGASSFSGDFGISPQDLMLSDAGSDAYKNVYPDAEVLQDQNGPLSTKSQKEDWPASMCRSQNQPKSGTLTQGAPDMTSWPSRIENQTSQNQQETFTGDQTELRQKRYELAVAEARVSTLRTEIKALEASTKAFKGIQLDNTPHTTKRKWSDDETTHRAKRIKEDATARDRSNSGNGEIAIPIKGRRPAAREVITRTMQEEISNPTDSGSNLSETTAIEKLVSQVYDNTHLSDTLYGGSGDIVKFECLKGNFLQETGKQQAVFG